MTAQTGRSVPEWKGKTPDTAVPPRVRRRVFDAYSGRCYLTGREILPGDIWQLEDKVALINGGENRESNKAPVLVEPHREKTRRDVAIKSKVARVRNKHLGIHHSRHPLSGGRLSKWKRKVSGEVVLR